MGKLLPTVRGEDEQLQAVETRRRIQGQLWRTWSRDRLQSTGDRENRWGHECPVRLLEPCFSGAQGNDVIGTSTEDWPQMGQIVHGYWCKEDGVSPCFGEIPVVVVVMFFSALLLLRASAFEDTVLFHCLMSISSCSVGRDGV